MQYGDQPIAMPRQRKPLFTNPSREDWPDDVKRAWIAHSAAQSMHKGRHGDRGDVAIDQLRDAAEHALDVLLGELPEGWPDHIDGD